MRLRFSRTDAQINLTNHPDKRNAAAAEGVKLKTPNDVIRYLNEDEEALEVVLPYIETDF